MLTDAKCKNATCPAGKQRVKLTDSGGLYLEVSPTGAKRWNYKYLKDGTAESAGKKVETRISLGAYPAVSLAAARKARDSAKAVRATGLDPVEARKIERLKAEAKALDTFGDVASAYMAAKSNGWSAVHRERNELYLRRDLLPKLAHREMRDISAPELISVLSAIEARGTLDALKKAQQLCSALWTFGVLSGKANANIATNMLSVFKKAPKRHYPAIVDPVRFGALLRHIKDYQGGIIVKAALQLTPLVFQRPSEVREMAWAEVDLEAAMWTIPPQRMKRGLDGKKNGEPHLVPLSKQAVLILKQLHPVTGGGKMVFPSSKSSQRAISDNTLRTALMAMGFDKSEHTVHGFRASARTMLHERLNCDPYVIEAQLAHTVKDSLGRAYNRTSFHDQRVTMMQQWADYLDKLAAGATVIQFKAA